MIRNRNELKKEVINVLDYYALEIAKTITLNILINKNDEKAEILNLGIEIINDLYRLQNDIYTKERVFLGKFYIVELIEVEPYLDPVLSKLRDSEYLLPKFHRFSQVTSKYWTGDYCRESNGEYKYSNKKRFRRTKKLYYKIRENRFDDKIKFGRYEGFYLLDVLIKNCDYIYWSLKNIESFYLGKFELEIILLLNELGKVSNELLNDIIQLNFIKEMYIEDLTREQFDDKSLVQEEEERNTIHIEDIISMGNQEIGEEWDGWNEDL